MVEELISVLSLPYVGGMEKTVRVYVPRHEENEKLPVIYMTDGQNLFEAGRENQLGCWFTREAIRAEAEASGKSAVIVGIHNDEGPVSRTNQLTPKSIGEIKFPPQMPEEMRKLIQPEGEIFDEFVVNTVMPAIEANFPVITGRTSTAFCGSSSGGLQAFFTAISHPDKFCMSGVFSPAFSIFSFEDVVRFTDDKMTGNMPYLYIYSGGADPLEKEICEITEKVYDSLSEFYPPEKLFEVILPEEHHHESAWESIFKDFLHTFLERRETF